MEIKLDTRNELFKRNEIEAEIEAEKNPSFDEVRKMIAEQSGKPEENIDVYNINGSFGSNNFKINSYIYDSKEDLDKAEQKTQKQRKADVEEAKKAKEESSKPAEEAPVEEKKETPTEEAPAEETKETPTEEAPVEDKPEEEKKAEKEEVQGEEESKEN